MPPFRSARYDPYGQGVTTSVAAAAATAAPSSGGANGSTRQRTLVGNGNGRGGAAVGHNASTAGGAYQTGAGVARRQMNGGGRVHDRIMGEHQEGPPAAQRQGYGGDIDARTFPQGHNSGHRPRYNAVHGYGAPGRAGGEGLDIGNASDDANGVMKTGAAPLAKQAHPLMEVRKRPKSHVSGHRHGGVNGSSPYGAGKDRGYARAYPPRHESNILSQAKRVVSLLLGQVPEEDMMALQKRQQLQHGMQHLQASSEEEILMSLLSAKSTVRILRLFLLIPLIVYVSKNLLPPLADRITRPKVWRWSAGVALPGQTVVNRNLAGRNCVMNYFIEKQPPDEYDPDFVEIKPGEKNKDGTPKVRQPVKIIEGTYRTKGQVHVISRFVEAVADSFRSNTKIRQHIIFTEVRDSGHLAAEAIRHWPPRGKHRTTVHVIASDELPHDDAGMAAAKALGYGSLEDIEERFRGNDKARIYDRDGNIAGLPDVDADMDDDEALEAMEIDVPDRETLELRMRTGRRRKLNATLPDGTRPYPELRALLPFEDAEDGEGEIVVPYLHIDGLSQSHQMLVLESARSLLEDNAIVVVAVEHSPDMDVRVLIDFFKQVKYKTFFLGARQIARIDNLCDEVLDDVLEHPSVSLPQGNWFRRLFIRMGLIDKDELRISGEVDDMEGPKRRQTPPFFVAMPKGRRSKEEMTIQHMYDLFGGYGGGGGQIKTANDRKAPGK